MEALKLIWYTICLAGFMYVSVKIMFWIGAVLLISINSIGDLFKGGDK